MADEKLNTSLRRIFPRRPLSLSPHPNRPQRLSPSRNRPGLLYLSPVMWLCPLTKSMSLWRKRDRTPAPKSKRRKRPKRRNPPIRRSRKSRARGRPPKAEKAATENQKAEKSAWARKGRPPKADKAAPDKPKPSKRDKVSRSDGKAPDAKEPVKPAQDTAPKETAAAEQTAPEPTTPPRPVEEGKLVYLKLSEVHPFHTFRPHPFKVRDDAKMQEIVASIRVNGVMVPGLARPEKDGNGYEIVAAIAVHTAVNWRGWRKCPLLSVK